MIRRLLGSAYLRVTGWTVHGTPPDHDHIGLMIAAPHTANVDFLLMLSTAWAYDLRPKYLIKKEWVRGPVGLFFKATGAIATDRNDPGTLVQDLAERARTGESFILVIAPEGTRELTGGWKSGFYRIALEGDIPVTPCSLDITSKQVCFGPTFHLNGDVSADMDRIREFYADKAGVHPQRKSPVRLSTES